MTLCTGDKYQTAKQHESDCPLCVLNDEKNATIAELEEELRETKAELSTCEEAKDALLKDIEDMKEYQRTADVDESN
jgi:galactose-1-phosphate uridylyltransferase